MDYFQDPASGVQEADEDHRDKRKRVIHEGGGALPSSRASYEVGSSSELNSKHRIFLSYSRSQRDFVSNVCKDLEDRHRFPFFDTRQSSLPLGETFEEYLLKAARECRLAVVVMSEEYLSSEWPMRELVEFMRAKSGSNPNLKILPLFFKLSIRDLGDESKQKRWFAKWAEWAKANPSRVNVADYENAFGKVKDFSGIPFNQDMMELGSYQKEVVKGICNLVSPDIKFYDEHVQGISSMYEDYIDKIRGIQPSGTFGVRVIGYYGMGGIGKTTMCETLCNGLSREFEDKVCHVEWASRSSSSQTVSDLKEVLKKETMLHLKEVLKQLTSTSDELLQELNESQCKDILCKRVSWQQKTFLALDNVWENTSLIEDVKMFIRNTAYHEGSVVMVTARSLTTLRHLGLDSAQCFPVPELSKADARSLFLFHAVGGRPFYSEDDIGMIDKCIAQCHFMKSIKQGSHYLPLALKVLGIHLGGLGRTPPQWLVNLPKARGFGLHGEKDNPVYGVIRLNYDSLSSEDQALFMDITVFLPREGLGDIVSIILWLGRVHSKSLAAIRDQLRRLKEKGLLEELDPSTGDFSIHDLYHEFAVWESQGKSNHEGFENQRWMFQDGSYSSNLESIPGGGVWQNLIRVLIMDEIALKIPPEFDDDWRLAWLLWGCKLSDEVDGNLSLQGIQWRYFSNVVVLNLHGLANLRGVLNLKHLYRLRSLELLGLHRLDGVEGLEDLKYLTYFVWRSWLDLRKPEMDIPLGQFPASLMVLRVHIYQNAKLRRDAFSRCTNLCNLMLDCVEASDSIVLDQCTSLESLELRCVVGPEFFASDELVDLHKLTRLQVLRIRMCHNISKVCGLNNLGQLRELHLECMEEPPNFLGLQNLHHLALSWCSFGPTVDLGTAGLPLLRHLDLRCSSFLKLPNLSKMTALEELIMWDTSIELQEEDIVMLAELPRLRPLVIVPGFTKVILDVVRRTLKNSNPICSRDMESDLGILPVRVCDIEMRYLLNQVTF